MAVDVLDQLDRQRDVGACVVVRQRSIGVNATALDVWDQEFFGIEIAGSWLIA
jgi:hypothetical protein